MPGRGPGIGLAVVRKIAQRANGEAYLQCGISRILLDPQARKQKELESLLVIVRTSSNEAYLVKPPTAEQLDTLVRSFKWPNTPQASAVQVAKPRLRFGKRSPP